MTPAAHMIVVGVGGMLRGVALEFAARGWVVSVIGRRPDRLDHLALQATDLDGEIMPLAADYTQDAAFIKAVTERCRARGHPAVVVAWIHSTAPAMPHRLAAALASTPESPDGDSLVFVHIVSHRSRPDRKAPAIAALPGLVYRRAVLGWVDETTGPRWLTHEEIAEGVIRAIDGTAAITRIGQTDPMDARPP